MAVQNIHAGTKLQILRRTAIGPPAVFQFLCMATTKEANFQTTLEDATVYDCDVPGAVPVRKSIPRQRMLDLPISGKVDAVRFRDLRLAEETSVTMNLRIVIDETLARGGGYWQGDFFIEQLQISSQENGIISFTCQFKSDGLYPWTDAAS